MRYTEDVFTRYEGLRRSPPSLVEVMPLES